jgi:hypothetical protein
MNYYTCPVCAFDQMTDAPEDFNICPCCGTEFENDTYHQTLPELRRAWITNGMQWFSNYVKPPKKWNPILQLLNAKLGSSLITPVGFVTHTLSD